MPPSSPHATENAGFAPHPTPYWVKYPTDHRKRKIHCNVTTINSIALIASFCAWYELIIRYFINKYLI